ncbi:hypothetical protein ACLKA7_001284 [Drosophila subpalustris]
MPNSEPGPSSYLQRCWMVLGNVKVIARDDEDRSAELYKAAVSKIGEALPWGATGRYRLERCFQFRPQGEIVDSVLHEGTRQTPADVTDVQPPVFPLMTGKWRRLREMPGPTSQAVIILNKKSLAPIEVAWRRAELLRSALSLTKIYKFDVTLANGLSDKPAEEDITEELEAPERPDKDGICVRRAPPPHVLTICLRNIRSQPFLDIEGAFNNVSPVSDYWGTVWTWGSKAG